jgi:CRISPR system Cascade subunit CasA
MTMVHDLVSEPLLRWRVRSGSQHLATLPGLLARLAHDEVSDFPGVRAHQFHPGCMFLTQLAALALRARRETELRISEGDWTTRILDLTAGRHEPWSLVVPDLSQPAFMQPPVPEGTVADWQAVDTPDELDVLVTSKQHDVKTGVVRGDDVQLWAVALVVLQTTQGYPGRGYNQSSRMKGGYGNRARVGVMGGVSPGSRFTRDVAVHLDAWPTLLSRGYTEDGIALVWTAAWDGATSLAMPQLRPHFIEVCQRQRMEASSGSKMWSRYTTTQARRCLPDVKDGDVGDPWIPIERDGGGALTVGASGFHYALVSRLLFTGDYEPAAAQQIRASDSDPILLGFAATARGQGKTEGVHERVVPLPGRARRMLGAADGRAQLGRRSALYIEVAKKTRSHVLFPALKRLASGGDAFPDQLDDRIDECFFEHLFEHLDASDDDARTAWAQALIRLARLELETAITRTALPDARRYRLIADAEGLFSGLSRKHFPDLHPVPEGASS